MDKLFEQSLLYDFYGELLTEHQREVYEGYVFDNLSLGEIASEQGISRQGVHDLIKRCDGILKGYEEKLHLVHRFMTAKEKASQIEELTDKSKDEALSMDERLQRIKELVDQLMEDF